MENLPKVQRYRTAIKRRKFSKPLQLLFDDNILRSELTFFDYGCGYGEDLFYLKKLGFIANGWDPHFLPEGKFISSSIVNLAYVLNVIEDPEERKETLLKAYALAEDLLVVSVLTYNQRDRNIALEKSCGDGLVTSWNTFQKYFKQAEFKLYLNELLDAQVDMVSLGVAYVFKTKRFIDSYVKNRVSHNSELVQRIREQEQETVIKEWLSLFHELGRTPSQTEFPKHHHIIRIFGSIENAVKAVRTELREDTIKQNAERRKNFLIVSICRAQIKQNGKAKMSDLTPEEARDVRLFYGKFESALCFAMEQLKALSELEKVNTYVAESKVGKILPKDIYIHKDSLSYAPEMLQILVELACMLFPKKEEYDIVKISRDAHYVSFLRYSNFFLDAHPSLYGSMKVVLHKNKLRYMDYSKSTNPPILHRKESFLHSEHPYFELFSQLSQAEEEAGLLDRNDIGTKKQWEKLLEEKDYIIADHVLKKQKTEIKAL